MEILLVYRDNVKSELAAIEMCFYRFSVREPSDQVWWSDNREWKREGERTGKSVEDNKQRWRWSSWPLLDIGQEVEQVPACLTSFLIRFSPEWRALWLFTLTVVQKSAAPQIDYNYSRLITTLDWKSHIITTHSSGDLDWASVHVFIIVWYAIKLPFWDLVKWSKPQSQRVSIFSGFSIL